MYCEPPDSWYEPDCDPEHQCMHCDDKSEVIENAREYLAAIISRIYSQDILDILELEDHIENLCHVLDVEMGKGELKIQRKIIKENAIFKPIEEWKEFNTQYLKQLV